MCNLSVGMRYCFWQNKRPDGKSADENDEGKELSSVTSEEIPTGESYDNEMTEKHIYILSTK